MKTYYIKIKNATNLRIVINGNIIPLNINDVIVIEIEGNNAYYNKQKIDKNINGSYLIYVSIEKFMIKKYYKIDYLMDFGLLTTDAYYDIYTTQEIREYKLNTLLDE